MSELNCVVNILLYAVVLMLTCRYCTEKYLCSREFTGLEKKPEFQLALGISSSQSLLALGKS